jgi:succinyl-CoA synthetase beta subunit
LTDVKRIAGDILGMQLVSNQTGSRRPKVRRPYIEDRATSFKEYYVSWSPTAPRKSGLHRVERRHGHRGSGPFHTEKIITEFI